MPRPSWKGYLRLSLVSVPIEAYTAAQSGGGDVHLNQLHAECGSRVRYVKTCPIHGEISNDEIVSGYEYAKGKYVVVDKSEREAARSKSDKAIEIEKFVPPTTIDPMFYSGRDYYLIPEGAAGQKPYLLLYRAMADEERYGVGQVALGGRDQLVVVRPHDGLLMMSILYFPSQVRLPQEFESLVPDMPLSKDELRLGRTLIQATSDEKLILDEYHDTYTSKLRDVIEAKVEGREVVAAPEEDEAPVINLMDALRQSVKRAGKSTTKKKSTRGRRKVS
jgi:DNA end-binding protein Ku